jgi:serine/threonine protein kinase
MKKMATSYKLPRLASASHYLYPEEKKEVKLPLPPITEKIGNKYLASFSGKLNDKTFMYETIIISNLTEQNCQRDRKYYSEVGKPDLGSGKWGYIKPACRRSSGSDSASDVCDFAMKITSIENDEDLDRSIRDAYYLNFLQNIRLNSMPIVPQLLDTYACGEKFMFAIVMDKYDSNMQNYGIHRFANYVLKRRKSVKSRQVPSDKTNLMFDDLQLVRMFQIAHLLSIYGIIHADLKADQFLYKSSNKLIVLTDFGFAGDMLTHSAHATHPGEYNRKYWEPEMGWPSESKFHACSMTGVSPASSPGGARLTDNFIIRLYLNVWQLTTWLETFCHTWIEIPETREIKLFGGFRLPDAFTRQITEFCPAYKPTDFSLMKPEELFVLDLETIGLGKKIV